VVLTIGLAGCSDDDGDGSADDAAEAAAPAEMGFCEVLEATQADAVSDDQHWNTAAANMARYAEAVEDPDVSAALLRAGETFERLAALDADDPQDTALAVELLSDPGFREAGQTFERHVTEECGLAPAFGDGAGGATGP
jgi:hypothetical protein